MYAAVYVIYKYLFKTFFKKKRKENISRREKNRTVLKI